LYPNVSGAPGVTQRFTSRLSRHKPDTSTGSNDSKPDELASPNWIRKRTLASRKHSLKVEIMKLVQSMIVAAVVAIPALSFAQSNQPLTRADVRAQLVELQQAGYNPSSDHTQYPKNI
jgi:hypothetical protein